MDLSDFSYFCNIHIINSNETIDKNNYVSNVCVDGSKFGCGTGARGC